ncbi:acetyl-CoA acetyltransferase [Parerythrobacter lacustris]|uniref:Acetyl-CoA acetyltransferase n=1 Tax=Parerythrobacter lacustris TaxID=2969984 RepID=A0ABT1XN39_9SPHN|nr:acetyl-CoA acetyltransferase [Parerythrobacter lacustris]
MTTDPAKTPVIVGVGQVNDRPATPDQGLDPVGLMAEALRRADTDAGGGWLADCDSLSVVGQIAWPQLNPVIGKLAEALGIAPQHTVETPPHGDSPTRLMSEAANRIARGEAAICAIVGGEALRTAGQLKAAQAAAEAPKPDALRDATHRVRTGYAQSYGLVVPTDVYPLYENAGRAAYGQTLAEGQAESGAIWSRFSEVAAQNEAAWIRKPVSAAEVVTPNDSNRPIAFPYTKLQVANASVNQGAGFIVTSLAEAQRRGVPDERIVFIGHGAAAEEDRNFLRRDRYDRSPSLEVTITEAMTANSVAADDLDFVELYSCFPCVPKMARRVLGWPVEKPASVFGGLTFGGGPIGNYMSHAVASMVEALRRGGGKGLLFANGGYATHNHAVLLSSQPLGLAFPQDFDRQAMADAARGEVPEIAEDYAGPATIESYTVHYDRDGSPRSGVIVARTPEGGRTLAAVRPGDGATIAFLTDGQREPVGTAGTIVRGEESELSLWAGC